MCYDRKTATLDQRTAGGVSNNKAEFNQII